MSLNFGAIYVHLDGETGPAVLLASVEEYWCKLGAIAVKAPPGVLKMTTLQDQEKGQLGYFIARRPTNGWVGIFDTEGYTCDVGLAKYLAKRHRTKTLAVEFCGVVDQAAAGCFGPWSGKPPGKGYADLQRFVSRLKLAGVGQRADQIDDTDQYLTLRLDKVPAARYESMPFPERKGSAPRPPWFLPLRESMQSGNPENVVHVLESYRLDQEKLIHELRDALLREFFMTFQLVVDKQSTMKELKRDAANLVHAADHTIGGMSRGEIKKLVVDGKLTVLHFIQLILACDMTGRKDRRNHYLDVTREFRVDLSDEETLDDLVTGMARIGDAKGMKELALLYRSRIREIKELVNLVEKKPSSRNHQALKLAAEHEEITVQSLYNLAFELGQSHRYVMALTICLHAASKPHPPWQLFNNALGYAMLSSPDRATLAKKVEFWLKYQPEEKVHHYYHNLACVHARLGDEAAAIEALGKAIKAGGNPQTYLEDGDLVPLRGRKDFMKLMSGKRPYKPS